MENASKDYKEFEAVFPVSVYPIGHFEWICGSEESLGGFYRPFSDGNFFKMVFSLKLLEKQSRIQSYFSSICIQKTILKWKTF